MNNQIEIKQIIYILVLTVVFSQNVEGLSQCKCIPDNSAFQDANTNQSSDIIKVSVDNELIGQQDVGKLLSLDSYVILQNTAQVNKQSYNSLNNLCPPNFSPITKKQLEALIQRPDFQSTIVSKYLNIQQSNIIFSSDKVYPDQTNGSVAKAYEFYVIKFDSKLKPTITTASAFQSADNDRKTICIRDSVAFDISLEGYEGFDLEEGKTYEFKIRNKNVQKYYIEDSNGIIYKTQTFLYKHKPTDQWGCTTINFKVQVFGGEIVADCLNIWTKPQFAFNSNSNIQVNQIKQVKIPNIKANVDTGMFFGPGSAPISPITNDSSSFYLYYSEKSTNALKVIKLTKEGVQIDSTIDTKETGSPFDIVSTNFGFVVMANDSTQKAWVTAFNKDGTKRWKRILVNNGAEPITVKDQIKFYDEECDLPTGMEVMYDPANGRLLYARGRIHIIWAHYNHFGYVGNTKEKNDHTGDTFISLDADTGYNQKVYWAWRSSHSLYQSLHFDGKNIYVASLGDAFPTNINFQICDLEIHTCEGTTNLIPGVIPGNGKGSSAGRQGSYIDIIGNRNEKFFIYQRKQCSTTYHDQPKINDAKEFTLIRFDKEFNLISTKQLIENADIASRVNTIKAVKYGKNILVGYNLIPSSEVKNFNRQTIDQSVDESYILLLNGDTGSIIYGPKKLDNYQINSADDWRILEDGRVVYTFVDKDNTVYLYYTPGLVASPYPNPIKSSDKVYGYGTFTNTEAQVEKNNYNDKCLSKNDSNYSQVDQQANNPPRDKTDQPKNPNTPSTPSTPNTNNNTSKNNDPNKNTNTNQNNNQNSNNNPNGSDTNKPNIVSPNADSASSGNTPSQKTSYQIINYTIISLVVFILI